MDLLRVGIVSLEATAYFVLVVMAIVLIHEMGHYCIGRLCGVGVKVFSIGFGPELFSFIDRHQTRWRLGMIPLGGYVQFFGDSVLSTSSENAPLSPHSQEEKLSRQYPADRRGSHLSDQPVWRRLLVILAGPMANFILALVLMTGLFTFKGEPRFALQIVQVVAGLPAERAGIQSGDEILSINNKPVSNVTQVVDTVKTSLGIALSFHLKRNNQEIDFTLIPVEKTETSSALGKIGTIGVGLHEQFIPFGGSSYGFFGAFKAALQHSWYISAGTVQAVIQMVEGLFAGRGAGQELGGVVSIASLLHDAANQSVEKFLWISALLSLSVGIFNLLPLPPLDGGQMLLLSLEGIIRRPLPLILQRSVFLIGLFLLLVAIIGANAREIIQLVFH